MLTFDRHIPRSVTDGAPILVLLHGRESETCDLMGLQPGLPQDVIVITPRAPFPGAQRDDGRGRAWHRFLVGTTPDPDSVEQSMAALAKPITTLPEHLPVDNVVSGREALASVGAELTIVDYPIGHWIDPCELADAARWLTALSTATAGRER